MKFWLLLFLPIILNIHFAVAQKISLEKWALHNVDSLHKNHVDTIEYYHAYCGECFISGKPTDTLPRHQCELENSWVEIENIIIYKQKSKYYSLTFDCNYPPIKKELKGCKSIDYFLSVIPVLNKRDKTITEMYRHNKFLGPIVSDGGYEEVFLYCRSIKQHVDIQDYQKTDKTWKSYFWIDKEIKLLTLVGADLFSKN